MKVHPMEEAVEYRVSNRFLSRTIDGYLLVSIIIDWNRAVSINVYGYSVSVE
jgi:hypothetical protein